MHIFACVVNEHTARFVLTLWNASAGPKTIIPPWRLHHQAASPTAAGLSMWVEGTACSLQHNLHVLNALCLAQRAPQGELNVSFVMGDNPTPTRLFLPLAPSLHGSRALQCLGTPAYGSSSLVLSQLHAIHRAWQQNGFSHLLFARTTMQCDVLVQMPNVACEVRRSLLLRFAPYFEQPIYQGVCLMYAQAMRAPLLALTDLDEHPPFSLSGILSRALRDRSGLLIFYDGVEACPTGYCPHNHSDFAQTCVQDRFRRGQWTWRGKPAIWKPIVVPHRVRDVGVHAFTVQRSLEVLDYAKQTGGDEGAPFFRLWQPCLWHASKSEGLVPSEELIASKGVHSGHRHVSASPPR